MKRWTHLSNKNSSSLQRRFTPAIESLEDRCVLDSGIGALPNQLLVTRVDGQIQTVPLGERDAASVMAGYRNDPGVLAVEMDQTVSVSVIPNDSQFGSLWGMNNTGQSGGVVDADIDAVEAWGDGSYVGNLKMAVGIIDTGMDHTHPDLYLNVWINQQEISSATRASVVDTDSDGLITFYDLNNATNAGKVNDVNANGRIDGADLLGDSRWADRVDLDGNGKIDDLIGWDFVNNDNNPMDDNNHGTHVAGTIGAIGNNGLGVAGVNWKVQMAGLKFLDARGSGAISNAVSALNYANSKGFRITNNSWGGGGYSSAMATAISNANNAGYVFVAAAGNSASNNDTTANYPSNYNYANVIAVAATTRTDGLASFSSYGATTVDLGAPGAAILSTVPNAGYSSFDGTSMATPQVAGGLALVWGKDLNQTSTLVVSRVLNNVDAIPSLSGKTITGGRLNVQKALAAVAPPAPQALTVLSAAPNGTTSFSSVRVTFNQAVDLATLSLADISLTGPGGGSIPATSLTAVSGSNNTQFDIAFANQTTVGTYTLTVGPTISSSAGTPMDQNGNGVGDAGDAYTGSFTISAPTGVYTFSNTNPTPIQDLTTAVSTITIGQNLRIQDVNVQINITHTYDSDLHIYLGAPDGTQVSLVRYRGSTGDNFTNTILDDEASTSVTKGRAPFSGSYRPESLLSALDNKTTTGTWTLYVYDRSSLDTGTLNSWSLTVTGTPTVGSLGQVSLPSVAKLSSMIGSPVMVNKFQKFSNSFTNLAASIPFRVGTTPSAAAALESFAGRRETLVNQMARELAQVRQSFASRLASLGRNSATNQAAEMADRLFSRFEATFGL